jgi:hypothetical protein
VIDIFKMIGVLLVFLIFVNGVLALPIRALPQAGWMTGFSRKSLPKSKDAAYVKRLIWETCCAMLGHFVMAFVGLLMPFAILLPWAHNKKVWLIYLWILAAIHFIFQILLVMIQRYNLPRFIRLRNLLKITQKKLTD